MPIAAIILAAGASSRLGQPKQLVRVGGETLLARTIRITRDAGAEPVFVVLGAESERIAASIKGSGAVPVLNPDWQTGMASSICAGVAAVFKQAPEATSAMLLVCDQPKLTAEHLRKLITKGAENASGNGAETVASFYAARNGVPAIFPRSEFAKLLALRGDAGARSLLQGPLAAVDFPDGAIDIDTADDLRRLGEAATGADPIPG